MGKLRQITTTALMAAGIVAINAAQPPTRLAQPISPSVNALFQPAAAADRSIPEHNTSTMELRGRIANNAPARRIPLKSQTTDDATSNIFGFLYFFQGSDLQQGMYSIGKTGTSFLWSDPYTSDWTMPMQAGWRQDGKVCGLNSIKFMGGTLGYGYIECDLKSGELITWKNLSLDSEHMENVYVSATYRDLDNRVYGYGYVADGSSYAFNSAPVGDIDASKSITQVPIEEVCPSLCYNVQDDLFYGVNTQGKFVSITAAGKQTVLFDLGISGLAATATGLTYNPVDGLYYFNGYNEDKTSAIYTIDVASKKVTKLYDCPYGEEYIFMICSDDNVAATAPARPTINSVNFSDASLSGTVSAKMPLRSVSDQALSGSVDWRLYIDGVRTYTGSAQAGATVSIPVADIDNGMHTFAITVGKDNNYSMPVTESKWIGSDFPSAPADVKLTENSASWSAVTTGQHNGYVNLANIKYTVYLNDQKVTETPATSCVINLPQGKPYTCYNVSVVATADNKASDPGISDYITYGEPLDLTTPIHYRPEEYEWPLFKTFDIDGTVDDPENPRGWHFSTTMGFPSFASGYNGDDLIIFPPMNFSDNTKAYRFDMEAGLIRDTDNTGTLEVLLGTAPTPEAMTQVIIPATRHYYMRGDFVSEYFAVKSPGTYYIGIRAKSNTVGFHISDMEVALSDRDADLPVGVNDLKAVAGANGELTATVTFTMPTKTANGDDIPQDADLTATVVSRERVINKPHEGTLCDSKTVSGAPGSKQTVTIKTLQNYNTIGVTCAIDGRAGSEATQTLYTGLLKPGTVENLKAEMSEDNMTVKLSWTPPTKPDDTDEGPIGDTFFYSLWYYNDGWQFIEGVGWDVLEAEVSLDSGSPQVAQMIGVMAMNAADQSDHIAATSIVIGEPYKLPMTETFPGYMETYEPIGIQRPSQEYQGTYWMVNDPAEVSPIFANASKVAFIGYIGDAGLQSGMSRLSFPKFNTTYMKSVNVSLTYWGGPYQADYFLLANAYGMNTPESIGTFPAGQGWITNSLDLPEKFLGKGWVELLLDTKFANTNTFALFSGYSISGIDAVEGVDAGEGSVFATPGMIHVAGYAGESLTICDMDGRVIASTAALSDLNGYAVAPGMYIVRAGANAHKIVVK